MTGTFFVKVLVFAGGLFALAAALLPLLERAEDVKRALGGPKER